jgi:hypothetical protein
MGNLKQDARSYKWNAATQKAITTGINEFFKGKAAAKKDDKGKKYDPSKKFVSDGEGVVVKDKNGKPIKMPKGKK